VTSYNTAFTKLANINGTMTLRKCPGSYMKPRSINLFLDSLKVGGLMFLALYEKVIINGTFGAKKVKNRLSSEISPVISYMIQVKSTNKLFKGKISGAEFEMMRVVGSRNSFIPFVQGRIKEGQTGCKIVIKMRPLLVTLLVTGFFFIAAIGVTLTKIFETGNFNWTGLIPLALVIGFYGYMTVIFKDEADFVKYHVAKFAGSDEFNHLQIDESYLV
jgi:hypothetical protein